MNSVTYNIPAGLVPGYRGRQVIVRSHDPGEIVQQLSGEEPGDLQYVQLLSADVEPDALSPFATWDRDIPLDIVISDPASEFPLLYNFSKLLDKHPIRVSIAVKPGFIKAVKLALALHFAVKLEVGQPDAELIEEMAEVLDLYLHRASVTQPVDYFHSIFLSFYRQEPADLWILQEEDPDYYSFVSSDGLESVSTRFAGVDPKSITGDQSTIGNGTGSRRELECDTCEFMSSCRGYFKWPDRDYDCGGVKSIFGAITSAAAELRENVASMAATQGGEQL